MKKLVVSLCLPFFTLTCICQNSYYFTFWKCTNKFENKKVIFEIDTSCSKQGIKFMFVVTSKIYENLKKSGIETTPIPFPNDTILDTNTLCLKFEYLKTAYVKLAAFGKIPLCCRVKVTQVQPKTENLITSVISVSVDKMEEGVNKMGVAFTKELIRHFKLK